jgi:hypothetical protein
MRYTENFNVFLLGHVSILVSLLSAVASPRRIVIPTSLRTANFQSWTATAGSSLPPEKSYALVASNFLEGTFARLLRALLRYTCRTRTPPIRLDFRQMVTH